MAGWLQGWDNRIKITIDSSLIDASLTWFPVMVRISAACGASAQDMTAVFDELGANSLKIAVTDSTGDSELYVEVEKWDDVGEEAILWVSKTGWSISNSADTIIYLYYDNDHADNITYVGVTNSVVAENVWDGNFMLVDHMIDGADNQHTYDSTSNDRDGTKGAAGEPTEEAGKVGYDQDFDGGDYITYGAVFPAAPRFMECVAQADDTTQRTLIGFESGVKFAGFHAVSTTWRLVYNHAYTLRQDFSGVGFDGQYHYFAIYCPANVEDSKLWIDEADIASAGITGTGPGGTWADFILADSGLYEQWDGNIDEVRLSDILRSDAWKKATYNTCFDILITFDAEALTPAVWGYFTWA